MKKYDRTVHILQLLKDHPQGLRQADLARRLNTPASTISRTIRDMSEEYPIFDQPDGRLCLDTTRYLTHVWLTMYELEALHISARLFSKVMRFPFPHAATALRKLADAQGKVSPPLAQRIRETAEDIEQVVAMKEGGATEIQKVIETLGRAITEGKLVEVVHFSRNDQVDKKYTLFPVTLEPHFEGRSIHLFAWDVGTGNWRTLKTERMSDLRILDPPFQGQHQIPLADLRPRLTQAWSIWTSSEPAQVVGLRFSNQVRARVEETLWHPSQSTKESADGGIVLTLAVAAPQEMYPWIRGWGPDVEVLEPSWLRDKHKEDFRLGLQMYENSSPPLH